MSVAEQGYHHGDLKNALVRAGLSLLEQGGPAAVSLRAVAREVGVSQAAPYAHFEGKRGLMSAIAAAGFERLRDRLGSLAPSRGIGELGLEYIGFATENPGLYNLMFGSNEHIDPADPELVRAGDEAFAALAAKTVRPGADPSRDPGPIAAWSLVHGLAMLLINEKLQPGRRENLPDVLRLLQTGLAHHLA